MTVHGVGLRRAAMAAALLAARTAVAATLVVTSAADAGPGTLRQAILDSNASAGVGDLIAFDLPPGVQTIAPLTALPPLTDPVTIDGATQPGYSGSPLVALDGALAGPSQSGLTIQAGPTSVRALAIGGFGLSGIRIEGAASGGSTIEGCYLGVAPGGTLEHGNGVSGISVLDSGGNVIGGVSAGAGNVIAGQAVGVELQGSGSGNAVRGNLLGIDASGSTAIPSSLGILCYSPATVIEGNLVSGHLGDGLELHEGAEGSTVKGNKVGTNAAGSTAVPNTGNGVSVTGASLVTIGGTDPADANLISGNGGNGVSVLGSGNRVFGNLIGTDASGKLPLGNRGAGVSFGVDADGNTVGGLAPGEGNRIAHNGGPGIRVAFGFGTTIRGNSVSENGGLAIDLLPLDLSEGPTPNDHDDVDEGGNGLQNFPIVASAEVTPGQTRVEGILRGEHEAAYALDFYADASCTARPGEFPEARTYLGSADVETDHHGDALFDVTLPAELPSGDSITATATDSLGNTSEVGSRLVFAMFPRSGPSGGGDALAVLGSDFQPGMTVTIGGVVVSSVVADETTIAAVSPALPPGTVAVLSVTGAAGPHGPALAGAWLSDFTDVAAEDSFHEAIAALALDGASAGCGGGAFCPDATVTRAQLAVLLLKARSGLCYAPPPASGGLFADVPSGSFAADWIEALATEGIAAGCGGVNFCPGDPVRRDQSAALLLKARHGPGYAPAPCIGIYMDVPCPSLFADWIEELAAEGVTGGCGGGAYCPEDPTRRRQMAVFLVRTFGL